LLICPLPPLGSGVRHSNRATGAIDPLCGPFLTAPSGRVPLERYIRPVGRLVLIDSVVVRMAVRWLLALNDFASQNAFAAVRFTLGVEAGRVALQTLSERADIAARFAGGARSLRAMMAAVGRASVLRTSGRGGTDWFRHLI